MTDGATTGDAVILLGGANGGTHVLEPFAGLLTDAGHRVIRRDHRPEATAAADLDSLMAGAADLIRSEAGGSCHVIGYSLGAMVGLRLALAEPAVCRSLSLISPRARTTEYQDALLTAMTDAAGLPDPRSYAAFSLSLLLSPAVLSNPAAAADWLDLFSAGADPRGDGWFAQASRIPDLRLELRRIDCPALVVAFHDDRLIDPTASREVAESLPEADFIVLPGLGHFGVVEAPGAVAKPVLEFLSRVG